MFLHSPFFFFFPGWQYACAACMAPGNHTGLRVQKVVNGVTTSYIMNGKKITHVQKGSVRMHFFYDAQGRPSLIRYNGVDYAYLHNLQGDIVGMIDMDGTRVVEYTYDAWGKPQRTMGGLAATLGKDNPFRYRGYVYDEETGLYYLRSRYYSPEWGRFINQDTLVGETGQVLCHNIFAYCANNPVKRVDADGKNFYAAVEGVVDFFFPGASKRAHAMLDDPSVENIVNWATLGYVDSVKGAVAPKEPLSPQHWMASFSTVATPFFLFRPVAPVNAIQVPSYAPAAGVQKVTLTYTKDVVDKMVADPRFHGFPTLIDSYVGKPSVGIWQRIPSKVGLGVELFKITGAIGGEEGFFEYIKDGYKITHRFFRPR